MSEKVKALIQAGKEFEKFEKGHINDFKDKTPFYRTRYDEERESDKGKIFTIRLNELEKKQLKEDMKLLKQVKPSTTLKQLWKVGRTVLHNNQTGSIIRIVLGNVVRNERIGIEDVNTEIEQK